MTFKLYPIVYHFPDEGKEFFIPRGGLPADSKRFDDLYKKHLQNTPWNKYRAPSVGNPGNWDNDLLAGVRAEEFRSLLKLTCCFVSEEQESLSVDDWMAVLKLARWWDMPDTHARAVEALDEEIRKKTAGEKIVLGKRYDVGAWSREGFSAFVSGKEQISTSERDELGWETYARLLEAKDKARTESQSADSGDTLFKETFGSHCA